MTEQHPLSIEELRESFEAAKDAYRTKFELGTAAILRDLSNTVSKMQEIGIDIGLQVIPDDSTSAYDMMYHVAGSHTGGAVEAHGYIHIGETSHLFAIANRVGDTAVSRLYLSDFNVGQETARSTAAIGKATNYAAIPGTLYDFRSDPEALQKLQKKLTDIAAQNAVVLENDPAGVFNAPAAPYTKPGAPKLRP